MITGPGIGVDDLAWIHADQFLHYVCLAAEHGDPSDWPAFRLDLLDALTAAIGPPGDPLAPVPTPWGQHALALLDELRADRDPAVDWHGFLGNLWSHRHRLRPDLQ